MSDWQKKGKEQFAHIARQAEIVVIKDRDVVAFIPEVIGVQGTPGMTIARNSTLVPWIYQTASPVTVMPSERILLWARLSATEVVSAYRWVPYVTTDNPDDTDILPFREVYSPRVTYDRTSNMLHLWFWTNIKYMTTRTQYTMRMLWFLLDSKIMINF